MTKRIKDNSLRVKELNLKYEDVELHFEKDGKSLFQNLSKYDEMVNQPTIKCNELLEKYGERFVLGVASCDYDKYSIVVIKEEKDKVLK